jgi:hypothetical protein
MIMISVNMQAGYSHTTGVIMPRARFNSLLG